MFSFATSGPVCGKAHSLIDRPVDVVFHYVCDDFFSNYPKWSPEVRRLDALTGGPLTLGSMARQVRIDHGQQSESTFRVTEYRRPERVSFAGVSDPYRCCYEFQDIPSPPSTPTHRTKSLGVTAGFFRVKTATRRGVSRFAKPSRTVKRSWSIYGTIEKPASCSITV